MSGVLEFVDTNDFTSMNVTDHYTCSDVEWDPTGRYVVTAVSFWKTKVVIFFFLKIIMRFNFFIYSVILFLDGYRLLDVVVPRETIKKSILRQFLSITLAS